MKDVRDVSILLSMSAGLYMLLTMIVDTMTALFKRTETIDQCFDTQLIR